MGLAIEVVWIRYSWNPLVDIPPLLHLSLFSLIFNCEGKGDVSVVHKNARAGQNKTSRLSTQE